MSNVTITGFPSGSVGALLQRASDGALIASVEGTVARNDDSRWTPSPNFSGATVQATRTACLTGEGVTFYVEGMNSDAIMFCDYEWNFDRDDYAFSTDLGTALWATSAGAAEGPFVGHVFRNAGTFTVRVRVYNHRRVEVFTGTTTVTVTDAATLPTYYYDPAESGYSTVSDSGPWTAGSFEDALTAAMTGGTRRRLLVKAGSTIDLDATTNRGISNIYIDRYGAGARPILQMNFEDEVDLPAGVSTLICGFNIAGADVTLRNLDIRSSYDATAPGLYQPYLAERQSAVDIEGSATTGVTIDACCFSGWRDTIITNLSGRTARWVINDCEITNWYNYGLFLGDTERCALVGCRIAQPEDTVEWPRRSLNTGSTGDRETHSEATSGTQTPEWRNCAVHGPLRNASWCKEFAVHQVYAHSLNGWTRSDGTWNGGTYVGNFKMIIQPCFRMMSGHKDIVDDDMQGLTSFSFWQVHAKGGDVCFNTTAHGGVQYFADSDVLPHGIVYSQCIAEGDHSTKNCWDNQRGNFALRSCLAMIKAENASILDAAEDRYNDLADGLDSNINIDPAEITSPQWVLGCTFATEITGRETLRGFTSSVRPLYGRGNLVLAADADAFRFIDKLPDKPTGMTTTGQIVATTVPTVPGTGSSALGVGYEFAPRRDIAGNIRPADAAAGAYDLVA